MSVSRSIFALVNDRDRAYFGGDSESADTIGFLGDNGAPCSAAATPPSRTFWSSSSSKDEAIAEADTLLLTVPNQLGVDYNAHVIEAMLKHVAPALGWR